ncbi:ferric reductase-like transmembrane domain-containing protein [Ideonella sp.]|uniref:ferredoxin reductase family protein n=1 Tax=Ideonella sp. TaxID=1929293 RepID=UPI003BB7A464
MKTITKAFWAFSLALLGLWLWADPLPGLLAGPVAPGFFVVRNSLIQLSGLLAIGMMSLGLVLAARPAMMEPWLGGLDKMYRLHKWLGIAGLCVSIVHWLLANGPKWATGWGWMARPAGGRPPRVLPLEPLAQLFQSWRGLAEGLGEWAFYASVLLIALALVKWFPYRWFFKTHRLLAIAYLVLVFHAVVLMNFSDWRQPVGLVMALLMAAGSVAAVRVLLRRVGGHRKVAAVVERVEHLADVEVLSVGLRTTGRWPGHEAGQFAFVTFDPAEGAHPYTLTSAWHDDGRLTLLIKSLGDYTRQLPLTLQVGQAAEVEGPYGRFTFQGPRRRQIWIGAGIGITPFVARMKALAQVSDGKRIDLIHCTAQFDVTAISRLRADVAASGVQLHLLVDDVDGRLDVARLCQLVPDWAEADVWFCGPPAFGQAMRQGLLALGLPAAAFHQELFEMR